jgi:hypothetical protein
MIAGLLIQVFTLDPPAEFRRLIEERRFIDLHDRQS